MIRPGPLALCALATLLATTRARDVAGQPTGGAAWEWEWTPRAPFQTAQPGETVLPAALSVLLPGAGQYTLGQPRAWSYLALEVAGWFFFLDSRSAGAALQDRYRDFAWSSGRIQGGARLDGDFEYYERMAQWDASGAFDADPGTAGVQPELNPATFNGSIWALAAQIFLPPGGGVPVTDPGYQAALGYYAERAYGTQLLWDWTTAPGGRQQLADLIEDSDERFRQATTALGFLIANHLVSAVDAYLSAGGGRAPASLRFLPDARSPGLGRWAAMVSIPVGR